MRSPLRYLVLCVALLARIASAAVPAGFTQTDFVTTGLGQITGIDWAPDGTNRLFVTLKTGAVRVVENGALLPTPFATETVFTASECGLIGIAFDPDYTTNRYVYLFVTVSSSEQRILRYTDVNNVGQDRRILIAGLPTRGANHDGGAIGFGPDGKLYWAIGDLGNGTGVNADLTSLAAKVGRANKDGTVASDNPFVDGTGPNDDFIWARGFRNPFTFTFHPVSGALWVNSVGTSYEQVFVVTRGSHAGYNSYENNQPAGYLTPVIVYRTNGTVSRTLTATGASRSGNVATFTTTATHGFRRGGRISIAGVTDTSFNGSFHIRSTPTPTTFTVDQAGPDASSGGGTAATQNLGGAISGGTFYDATQFPADHRGDFFFGDYNSGRILRAQVDPGGTMVEAVDYWADALSSLIDLAVGPDGALYAARHGGNIVRIRANATGQALVISRLHLRMAEGGQVGFAVSLAQAPSSNVTVTVARASGDADVSIASGASLTFTPSNWSVPQRVTVAAAQDGDSGDDTAGLSVSAPGIGSETVSVAVTDDDPISLVVSQSTVPVNEGSSATFTVALAKAPASPITVQVRRTAGDADVAVSSGGTLTFTPADHATPQVVTVAAAQDADSQDDAATLTLSAPGVETRTVAVVVGDDDPMAPTITSSAVITAVRGAPYRYDVEATGRPAPTFSVTGPAGMTIDPGTGLIQWSPQSTGTFPVTVRASNGIAPDATQGFTVTVDVDRPPTAVITLPKPGAVLSGVDQEFFGDCQDDVGCVRAEFYVDDALVYTDTATDNHFHAGGGHQRFDTTAHADGVRTLRLRVVDTAGQSGQAEVQVELRNGNADGGAGTDGGSAVPRQGGCGCQAGGSALSLVALSLIGLGVSLRRRRSP